MFLRKQLQLIIEPKQLYSTHGVVTTLTPSKDSNKHVGTREKDEKLTSDQLRQIARDIIKTMLVSL